MEKKKNGYDSIAPINPNGLPSGFNQGLTKREYFAAMAMQGLWASVKDDGFDNYARIAEMAILQADALIEALNQ